MESNNPNPLQSPAAGQKSEGQNATDGRLESLWQCFMWAVVGFATGTASMSVLVLSTDPLTRLEAGALMGGTPGALIGAMYALRKS